MVIVGIDRRQRYHGTKSIVLAFALSLVFHLVLFGMIEAGLRLGWWSSSDLPQWLSNRMLTQITQEAAEIRKKRLAQEGLKEQEIPLLFVSVDPAQATAETPKDAQFYSAKNSIAANPDPRQDTTTPKIDGTQDKVVQTVNTPRPIPFPLQPAPPPMQADPPTLTQPAKPVPEPAAQAQPPEAPPPGDLAMLKPSTSSLKERREAAMADPPPRTKPRRLAMVKPPEPARSIAGEAMKQDGGVRRRAVMSSLDVKATPFGTYDEKIIAAIQQRWFDLLDERGSTFARSGRVVLEFRMTYDGKITDMRVAENTVGEMLAFFCQRAVLDPAPYEPWPSDMRRMIGANYRDVRFTFYYN